MSPDQLRELAQSLIDQRIAMRVKGRDEMLYGNIFSVGSGGFNHYLEESGGWPRSTKWDVLESLEAAP